MAELTVQKTALNGLDPTYTAASATGDTFVNDGRTFLHIKNADVASKTVTIDSKTPCSYGHDHDIIVTVPAGDERVAGPFPNQRFNDVDNKVNITYDAVTSLTIAAIKN